MPPNIVRKPLSNGHRYQAVGCHVRPSMQAGLLCKLCKVQHVPRALERKLRYVRTKTGHMGVLVRSIVRIGHKRRSLCLGLFESLRTVG